MIVSKTLKKHRFVFATIAGAVVIIMIIAGLFSIDNATNDMIVKYIETLGWQIDSVPSEITHLTLPEHFDAVYETYSAVQTHSGFPFADFKGKRVTRYTYNVLNHKNSKTSKVTAGVFVYENTIIGAEISSGDMNGFMHAITETANISSD
ncbi:MAG: DUF4830 domain-containing protein [Clostridia bacterium]|nr:DUF4830 domain-containing protein [Clostridia bacterium]MBQ9758122.1 DUF4830 domain-containing protein [Clostridia bacterium]